MADAFDPYREKLIVETRTIWPDAFDHIEPADRLRIAAKLHSQPDAAANLEYVRIHSGFSRQITVTPEDVARVG
jgi:hypothetical protein